MGGEDRLEIRATQVVGGALAAGTAAVAASFLGVTGTVIGAALASVGTTVGNAVYTHYIERGHRRLREHGLIAGAGDDEPVTTRDEEGLARAAHATLREHAPADRPRTLDEAVPLDSHTAEVPRLTRTPSRRRTWTAMAVATVAIFSLSMGGILAFELLSGKPLSATVHGRDGTGTTFGGTVSDPASPVPSPGTTTGESTEGSTKENGSSTEPSDAATGPADRQETEPAPADTAVPAAPDSSDGTGAGTEPPRDEPGVVRPSGQ
ncbi:hypothetical protein GCM10009677_38760 [Sphaerisporangium rubeum]|uniref:Uncharacterized protein n=1 Tax=Sphaerisporangium rubeum TaxID=321317 RepID=A0A7X0IFL0_9ACTN|nr:hypothetical protein [Sphaerisporangium rubeum]MBB6472767.1 hypothetical protein [Sphaerisporangium rubeum]